MTRAQLLLLDFLPLPLSREKPCWWMLVPVTRLEATLSSRGKCWPPPSRTALRTIQSYGMWCSSPLQSSFLFHYLLFSTCRLASVCHFLSLGHFHAVNLSPSRSVKSSITNEGLDQGLWDQLIVRAVLSAVAQPQLRGAVCAPGSQGARGGGLSSWPGQSSLELRWGWDGSARPLCHVAVPDSCPHSCPCHRVAF